jgi:hypothetical protein
LVTALRIFFEYPSWRNSDWLMGMFYCERGVGGEKMEWGDDVVPSEESEEESRIYCARKCTISYVMHQFILARKKV